MIRSVTGRGAVLRDQSNLDLTPSAARTPKPPASKGHGSPIKGTDSAIRRTPTSGAFAARQNSGQVVAALNEHLTFSSQARDLNPGSALPLHKPSA
jgi:hypothetical protein